MLTVLYQTIPLLLGVWRTDMNDSDKLQSICADRDAHRAEIVEMKSSLMHLLFAFLTFAAGGAGVYWGNEVIKDPVARAWLLFAVAQMEFLVSLISLQILLDIGMHAAYIATLEKKINQLVGETVTAWESVVIRSHYLTKWSTVYWNTIALGFVFLVVFSGLMLIAALQFKSILIVGVLVSELVFFIVMAILIFNEPTRVAMVTESVFNSKGISKG